jgi:hypothetical protein
MGVGVLRNVGGGLDYSEMMKQHNVGDASKLKLPDVHEAKTSVDNNMMNAAMMSKTNSFYVPTPTTNDILNASVAKTVVDESAAHLLTADVQQHEVHRSECKLSY